MRVRVNFTLGVDVEEFCEKRGVDLTKVQVREAIQEQALHYIIMALGDEGINVDLLGRNNVYDPKQKLTVAEHLVQ